MQPPLGRRGTLTKDFEDQARAVDDLAFGHLLEVLLLNGREDRIDQQQRQVVGPRKVGNLLRLSLAEQARWANLSQPEAPPRDNVDADRSGEARRFFDPRFDRS